MIAPDDFFSYLCHSHHRFLIDGIPLPLCQRCLGLYSGAALTALWLLASGLWRRGLPPGRVVLLHAALLLTALLGGLHALDLGPTWRMLCGVWTGHVAIFWLAAGTAQIRTASRGPVAGARIPLALDGLGDSRGSQGSRTPLLGPAASPPPWDRRATIHAWAAAACLALFAILSPLTTAGGRAFWVIIAVTGLISLAAMLMAAALAIAVRATRISRRS